MARFPQGPISPETKSFLTHWEEQAELAAQAPWWMWVVVAACVAMCALMVWHFVPKKPPQDPTENLPRDEDGKLIPPWKWGEEGR